MTETAAAGPSIARPLALRIVWVALTLAYPLVVLVGLRRWPTHVLSLALAGLVGALLLAGRWTSRGTPPADRSATTWPLVGAGLLLLLGAVLRQTIFVKAIPVLVSVALLATFAMSLRNPPSMVERFARREDPELSLAKVRYCRRITIVWCGFFVLNIAVTLALAAAAPLSWWSLYTGVVAYALVATLFTVEYVVRKRKFRDYGRWWHDRVLAAIFPPRDDDQ